MNRQNIHIRIATAEDAASLLKIYAPYVEKTAVTFEYEVPGLTEFQNRIEGTLEKYPYIVAVHDGEILGYAYAGAFVGRTAYDWSAETSIYLDWEKRGMGLGGLLYQTLEEVLKAQNITNLNACIAYPDKEDAYLTKNSVQFHAHLGYSLVGEFHKCGYKFGRWYNMVWMEKIIGRHVEEPLAVIPFFRLGEERLAELGIR